MAAAASASSAQAATDPVALSRQIAAPWPALQGADGKYPDYLERKGQPFRSLYGDAMLGYGLIQAGLRDSDQRAIESGLRGVTRGVRTAPPPGARQNAFEDLAVAAAYNLARATLGGDPRFASVRGQWEDFLRRSRYQDLTGPRSYYNYFLVESVMALELLRTGLSSNVPGAVLSDPAGSRARAVRLINTDLPKVAKRFSRSNPGFGTLAVLPDPPRNPLAYHALQLGLLAHAVDLLGGDAGPQALTLLTRAAEASAAIAAPDGDVSWFGRSQEMSWTTGLTAFGAETAAAQPGTDAAVRARLLALSDSTLERLGSAYGVSRARHGLAINPALRGGKKSALRGLDSYVGNVDYAGLTLVALNWAIDRRAGRPVAEGQAGADRSSRLQHTPVSFATVRKGDLWFAVKERPTGVSDIRYDFGLVALKARAGGTFADVLPIRPKTPSKGKLDSAGPILLSDGSNGFPYGRKLSAGADGVVTMTVDFRAGPKKLRSGVPFRFAPQGRCVQISWPAKAGERYEYSAFLRGGSTSSTGGSDARQRITFSDRVASKVEGGFASGTDATLKRARFSFTRSSAGTASITTCPS